MSSCIDIKPIFYYKQMTVLKRIVNVINGIAMEACNAIWKKDGLERIV